MQVLCIPESAIQGAGRPGRRSNLIIVNEYVCWLRMFDLMSFGMVENDLLSTFWEFGTIS